MLHDDRMYRLINQHREVGHNYFSGCWKNGIIGQVYDRESKWECWILHKSIPFKDFSNLKIQQDIFNLSSQNLNNMISSL
jgi:hypothetical protein